MKAWFYNGYRNVKRKVLGIRYLSNVWHSEM